MLLVLGVSAGHVGCYYLHLASGQWRILRARRDIDRVLADPATRDPLRSQLELVLDVRRFSTDLGLRVDEQYTSYVPWPDDRIVTSVVATRSGEIEPAGFDFPVVGHVPYKGFFERERAESEADALRTKGLDVCVLAVPAYSTLGWLADPVTEPMLLFGDVYLVQTVIHELVHATVFFPDAADFNEGIASFIGQEGAVRFYAARGEGERARAAVEDQRRIEQALLALRDDVRTLYGSTEPGPEREQRRAALEATARDALASLPLRQRDAAAVAEATRLNDACLSIAATYAADVPAYAARLAEMGGDLRAFVARTVASAEAEDPRAAILAAASPTAP